MLLANSLLSAQESDDESSVLDLWSDTLTFGIDSELPDVLTQLRDAQIDSLDELIVARFARTRSTDLKVSVVEHFQLTESAILVPEAEAILLSGEIVPPGLLRVLLQYRTDIDVETSPELIERYSELSRDETNTLASNAAIEALGDAGTDEANALLLELLGEISSSDLLGSVIRALGVAGSQAAVDRLTTIARDEFAESSHRQYAAESLGRIGSPDSVQTLTDLLSDPDSLLRAYATYALGFYAPEETASILEEALLDSFWRVRVAALQAIEEQEYAGALAAVEYKATRDPERPVREAALRTLGTIGPGDIDVLRLTALNERVSSAERAIAIEEISSRGAASAVEPFADIMTAEWDQENSRPLDAVGREISAKADAAYAPLYERLLGHPNFIMQIYGIRGIGNAGLSQYEEQLQTTAALTAPTALARAAQLALEAMGIEVRLPEESEEDAAEEPGTDTGSAPDESAEP